MVECAALEMQYTGNRIEGSNPSLSAIVRLMLISGVAELQKISLANYCYMLSTFNQCLCFAMLGASCLPIESRDVLVADDQKAGFLCNSWTDRRASIMG